MARYNGRYNFSWNVGEKRKYLKDLWMIQSLACQKNIYQEFEKKSRRIKHRCTFNVWIADLKRLYSYISHIVLENLVPTYLKNVLYRCCALYITHIPTYEINSRGKSVANWVKVIVWTLLTFRSRLRNLEYLLVNYICALPPKILSYF